MTGTLVNCAAVLAGSAIGLIFKKGIKESYTESINKSLGLAVLIIGINGVISNMFSVENGRISSSGELLLVVFLVIGTFIGELLKLDDRFTKFSNKIDNKFKNGGFSAGFISGTLIFNVGAMAVIGSINDGLSGDSSVLFVKSALDFTTSVILASTLGFGVIFTPITVLVYQGLITLLAGSLSDLLTGDLLGQICTVGYAIIMAIGFNFIFKNKFKTLNMLPAIILPVVYHYILILIEYIKDII